MRYIFLLVVAIVAVWLCWPKEKKSVTVKQNTIRPSSNFVSRTTVEMPGIPNTVWIFNADGSTGILTIAK